jgi:hypothetical protein
MGQAIEERGGQLLVAGEDGDPFGKREIGRDDGRASLVPIGDQIEEQLAADAVERDKAELVNDQDVDAQEPLLQPGQLAGIAGFNQLTHEVGRPGEEHPSFLLRRFHAERDGEVRFSGPDRAEDQDVVGLGENPRVEPTALSDCAKIPRSGRRGSRAWR